MTSEAERQNMPMYANQISFRYFNHHGAYHEYKVQPFDISLRKGGQMDPTGDLLEVPTWYLDADVITRDDVKMPPRHRRSFELSKIPKFEKVRR